MDVLLQDLRYATRRLRQAPGFTLVAVLIIALGIGANTAMFSVVNAVLLRPQPFARPAELVNVYVGQAAGRGQTTASYPEYRAFREERNLFADAAAFELQVLSRPTPDGSEVVFAEVVSANYWDVLGLSPWRGRGFRPDEERPGSAPVAVMGHETWRRKYGADPSVVGSTVRLNGTPVTIVGIGPRDYRGVAGAITTEFWIPTGSLPAIAPDLAVRREGRSSRSTWIRARLNPGVTVARAQAGADLVMDRLAGEFPETDRGYVARVVPASGVRFHPVADEALYPVATLMLLVVGLVLAIACSNLANLLLARATTRRKEVALRLALGSSRGRLVRQLMTESILLAAVGGAIGLGIATLLVRALVSFQPPIPVPVVLDLRLDVRVLGFAALLSLATGVLFGLAPALRATRPDLVGALKGEESAIPRRRRFGLRNALVVVQVSVSLLLLVGAALFVRSLRNAERIDPGFEPERAAILTVSLGQARLDSTRGRALIDEFLQRVRTFPGVRSAALVDPVPLGYAVRTHEVAIAGFEPPPGSKAIEINSSVVGPDYFDALRIPLVRGRGFAPSDDATMPGVVVVSEAMARRFWGSDDVVGRRFRIGRGNGRPVEIVGVARDTKVRTLGETPAPYLYTPFAQDYQELIGIVAATTGDPAPMLSRLRAEFRRAYPDVPIFDAKTMSQHLGLMLFLPRMGAGLLSLFGLLAAGLASLGLYGVVAFTVAERTREIGVRIALGAESGQVMRLVVRGSMGLVAVGLGLGLLLALLATRPLAGALYGVAPSDPVALVGAGSLLALVGLVASLLPAIRATRVDPLTAIRAR